MSSQRNRNAPSPIKTTSPHLTPPRSTQSSTQTGDESFHGTLVELSAALAILEAVEPQRESSDSTGYDLLEVKQFESASKADFKKDFNMKLQEVLWAFAVMFSKSRTRKHVVASVLREQTQEDDNSKSLFTLYLTTNRGFWPNEYDEHKRKLENAANCDKTPPSLLGALWDDLTDFCFDRIEEYAEQARKCFLGIPTGEYEPTIGLESECKKTFDDIKGWCPNVYELLIELRRDLSKDSWDQAELVNKSWEALLALSKNSSRFPVLRSHRQCAKRRDLILKSVENLAKVRKAYLIFAKFGKTLRQKGAHLKIELLGKTYESEAEDAIDRLISDQNDDEMRKSTERVKKAIKGQKGTLPHCEIQMLMYFSRADKKGVWNLIGCSKRPCYACSHLLAASGFLSSKSHGKAYHQYFSSIENWLECEGNEASKAAIKELRRKVVESIQGYGERKHFIPYTEPDSPVFQDWLSEDLEDLNITSLTK
ncbi:hypothetical protein F5B22DRAFT_662309 [Xylaria bambusicola]|uniref:uncharacterized protein n=1 Tax=Xylaria bambusicola TaxID=326684 RepID=UPI002007EE0B|nr:uncharacterized protein F5B22DRAFT_662309 [Xylaria bambusicola]KAI0503157.1 hypothetical protein F5B22DRAFT_662309 [Xylaria bambusicola]